jgi:uncharacterized protein YbaR (Trm112 family)
MLLDKLACPGCKGKLQYEPEKSRLLCMKCKLEYKIENDIPVLLVSEAAKIK